METVDWTLVVVLNGSIILYALWKGRDTETSSQWFLAGRSLPWWIVGLSMYATAIDASDLVADSGGAYDFGLSMFVVNWVGVVAGWYLMGHYIALPMYRAGMYTNAEYLEARFGPAARITSALIQLLYRTAVIGILSKSVFLMLTIVAGFSPNTAWTIVVAVAAIATVYTMIGGLKSVAMTDAMQSVIMIAASLIIFACVWSEVGGWSGVEEKLNQNSPHLADRMLHVGADRVEVTESRGLDEIKRLNLERGGAVHDESAQTYSLRTPAWLVCLTMAISGLAYSIVNHTQSMRMFGARSEWDLKMSVVAAGGVYLAITFLNLSMGVMGRAMYPDPALMPLDDETLRTANSVFPLLVRDFATVGIRGIVVAGVVAACFSTYDSIGSTISALVTRDIYARLIVSDRDDAHYLKVGRLLTPVVIFGSFVYIPIMHESNMFEFYLDVVAAFVVPLLTVYLMGTFTSVAARSGAWGLFVGVGYGIWTLVAFSVLERSGVAILPRWLLAPMMTAPVSLVISAATMIVVSLICGWHRPGQVAHIEQAGWLRDSQEQVQHLARPADRASGALPVVLGLAVVAVGVLLSFVVFW